MFAARVPPNRRCKKLSQTGKLIVQVYTGQRAFPVSGACVSMLDRAAEGKRMLKAFRRSGPDGLTNAVEFETPDESISLNEYSREKAYMSLDILVDYPGFFSAYIEGAQIFSGQTSRQEVNLIPLTEAIKDAGEGGSFTYYIPPQNL